MQPAYDDRLVKRLTEIAIQEWAKTAMTKMHVKVDLEACQGHGLCYFAAEALYEIRDSDGRAIVILDPVPDELRGAARKSAEVCPERAITIIEE